MAGPCLRESLEWDQKNRGGAPEQGKRVGLFASERQRSDTRIWVAETGVRLHGITSTFGNT